MEPSPQVSLAARLYASGAGSKIEIARSLGMSAWPKAADALVHGAKERLDYTLTDTGTLLRLLAREGLETIAEIMRSDETSPAVRLAAARDLADRGPETSKVQRHAVAVAQFSGDDLRALAEAMGTALPSIEGESLELVTIDQDAASVQAALPRPTKPVWDEPDGGPLSAEP